MYRRRRRALIERLGGKCESCGRRRRLEFHHPFGREWIAREKARWVRIKLYEIDAERGNLKVLCAPCNKTAVPETPF